MKTPGVVLPSDRKRTEVDRKNVQIRKIRGDIKAVQEKCQHDFKLIAHRELRRTLVPGVYQKPSRAWCRVQCTLCSKREVRQTWETCPVCGGQEFAKAKDLISKYFGPRDRRPADAMLTVSKCECGFTFVDQSGYLLNETGDKYYLPSPETADKIAA